MVYATSTHLSLVYITYTSQLPLYLPLTGVCGYILSVVSNEVLYMPGAYTALGCVTVENDGLPLAGFRAVRRPQCGVSPPWS